MSRCVIINADDFGLTDGICRGILGLLSEGAITTTSLMTAADGATARFRKFHAKSLAGRGGVHLQLSGGRPLSPAREVRSLIDAATGRFSDLDSGNHPEPGEVAIEWRRQVEAACAALGGPPTHLDTHHGFHRIPELFEIYVEIASELGVPVRGPTGAMATDMRERGIRGTIALVRGWTGKGLSAGELLRQLRKVAAMYPAEECIEVVAHPGYCDPYLEEISTLNRMRETDLAGLLELKHRAWPFADGFVLAHTRCC